MRTPARLLAALTMGALLAACGTATLSGAPRAAADDRPTYTVTVTRIVDGDTLDVTGAGGPARVRLLAVNTAERGECSYREAGDALRKLVPPDTTAALGTDPLADTTDRYGRLLRTVRVDGLDMSERMVALGWAEVYEQYPTTATPRLRELQGEAKRDRAGRWGMCR